MAWRRRRAEKIKVYPSILILKRFWSREREMRRLFLGQHEAKPSSSMGRKIQNTIKLSEWLDYKKLFHLVYDGMMTSRQDVINNTTTKRGVEKYEPDSVYWAKEPHKFHPLLAKARLNFSDWKMIYQTALNYVCAERRGWLEAKVLMDLN